MQVVFNLCCMRLLFSLILSFLVLACFSQQKRKNVYFLKNDGTYVDLKDSADYIRIIAEPDSGSKMYPVDEYFVDGKKKLSVLASKINPLLYEGQCVNFYKNGSRKSLTFYADGRKIGDEYDYYPNGKLFLVKTDFDKYDPENDLINNYFVKESYDSLGTAHVTNGNGYYKGFAADSTVVYEEGTVKDGKRDGTWKGYHKLTRVNFVETFENGKLMAGIATYPNGQTFSYSKSRGVRPVFKGGMDEFYKYLSKNVVYPEEARKAYVQGIVRVSFFVEKDGIVDDVKVLRSVGLYLDNAALQVVANSPRWMPGTNFGVPVRVRYIVPVSFTLE